MIRLTKSRIVFLVALAVGLTQAALAQQTLTMTPFSADMTITAKRQGTMAGKIYAGASKWRMDMQMQGQEAVMIFDGTSQAGYMLMPKQKMYMETRANKAMGPQAPRAKPMDPNNPCADDPNVTCAKTGTETINGRTTDRWEFTSKNKKETYTAWVDQKLHFPIKTETSDGNGMELTNVEEGAQPANLFEIPSDYKKFDMGGMMQGMPGMPR